MTKENEKFYRVNSQIRMSPVVVINPEGRNLGPLPTARALDIAVELGLDLVEIAPNSRPPVCRIMDFGKFRFDQNVKDKKQKRKQKQSQVKEVRLSPAIQEHDLETKAKAATKFLEAGHRVNVRLDFRRRENAHRDIGMKVIEDFVVRLHEHGTPASKPKSEGRSLFCLVDPKEKDATASNERKG